MANKEWRKNGRQEEEKESRRAEEKRISEEEAYVASKVRHANTRTRSSDNTSEKSR
jgi:hypothetical protein